MSKKEREIKMSKINLDEYVETLLASDEKAILLYGESGTGKSTIARNACKKLGLEYTQAQCSANTDENTILGGFIPNVKDKKSEFTLVKKALTLAFEEGKVCIIDELNLAQPDTLSLLNSMLDDVAIITLDNGDIITRHPGFRLICTENTGLEGCKYMNSATMNRFYCVRVSPLTIHEIYDRLESNRLINQIYLDTNMFSKLESVLDSLKSLSLDVSNTITYRNFDKMYRLLNYMYLKKDKPADRLAYIKNDLEDVVSLVFKSCILDVFIENQDDVELYAEEYPSTIKDTVKAIAAYYSMKYTNEDRILVDSADTSSDTEDIREDIEGDASADVEYIHVGDKDDASDIKVEAASGHHEEKSDKKETKTKELKKESKEDTTEEKKDKDELDTVSVDLDVVMREL